MNVILVSDRLGKTRTVSLGTSHIVIVLCLLIGLGIGFAILLQGILPKSMTGNIGLLGGQTEAHAQQQLYVRSSLDEMARKLGQMQAQIQRLDALGGRLAKLTGMKPQEFMFDQPPAQGGPLITATQQEMSPEYLSQQLQHLGKVVADRNDKLIALETMLMQNQLNRDLLPSISPVPSGFYSSNFGWRIDPFTGQSAMHEGVDYMVPEGTAITASAGGVVAYSANHPQYGNMVEIDHGNDIITRYAHASRLLVKVGQVVRSGEKIAEVGSTGRSTGSHLHFEVRYKGIAQNPVRFLQKTAS
jgi:murein DD-endopeptidase MepM/ murein hydrolase activator NlpD